MGLRDEGDGYDDTMNRDQKPGEVALGRMGNPF